MKKKQQPGCYMLVQTQPTASVCSKCGKCCTRCANVSLPLVEHKFSPTSGASGADENNDDPDDEHEFLNTETDKNLESKKIYI